MRSFIPVVLVLICGVAANAQVIDPEVLQSSSGVVISEGGKTHDLEAEVQSLDGMRNKLLASLNADLKAGNFQAAGKKLAAMHRFHDYCRELQEKVARHEPGATEVVQWLGANAAVIAAWESSLKTATPLAENSHLEDLENIKTKLGREFDGSLARHINRLRDVASSPAASNRLQEASRRVRAASGTGPENQSGVVKATIEIGKAYTGRSVPVAIALEIGSGGDGRPVDVSLKVDFKGPRSGTAGTITRRYQPGEAIASTELFAIDTSTLPKGEYEATLFVADDQGRYFKETCPFTVTDGPLASVLTFVGTARIAGVEEDIELQVDVTGVGGKVVGGHIGSKAITPPKTATGSASLLGVTYYYDFQAGTDITGTWAGATHPGAYSKSCDVLLSVGPATAKTKVAVHLTLEE